ncbi:MAG: M1 family metallopeptidase [Clostridia bacterium]|nr:M1 family metallopeptidase [Clostridia bacterium]
MVLGVAVFYGLTGGRRAGRIPDAPPAGQEIMRRSEGLDLLSINASFNPEASALLVRQQLALVNREDAHREALVLRAYPNAFQSPDTSPVAVEEWYSACYPYGFSTGWLAVSSAMLAMEEKAAEPARYRYTDPAKTVMRVELPQSWAPGTTLLMDINYTLNLPRSAGRFGENDGIWAIGNGFLIPAVYEEGSYREDPYYSIGDPFLSECANYAVVVDVPGGYICAGSAWPVVEDSGAGLRYTFDAPCVRDFALCISKDYQQAQALADGILVTVYARSRNAAAETLRYACQALACYCELYGPYPYPAFTLAQVNFPFGGMEYPSLVMLSGALLNEGGQNLELLTAHETAHQWWYAVVGSDQVQQAWQDEALCEYSLLRYVGRTYGRQAREDLQYTRIETAMQVTIPKGVTPGSPLSYFSDMNEYSLVVYRRGAALLCALEEASASRLDDFLKAYYDTYAFKRASRQDFETLLARVSGRDWSALISDYLDTYLTP